MTRHAAIFLWIYGTHRNWKLRMVEDERDSVGVRQCKVKIEGIPNNAITVNVNLDSVRTLKRFRFMEVEGNIALFNQIVSFFGFSFVYFGIQNIRRLTLELLVKLPDVKLCPPDVKRAD